MAIKVTQRIVSASVSQQSKDDRALAKDGKFFCDVCQDYTVVKKENCEMCEACGGGKCAI